MFLTEIMCFVDSYYVPYDLCIAAPQFYVYLQWVLACLAWCLNSVTVKALVSALNQEKNPSRGLLCDCEIFANLRFKL